MPEDDACEEPIGSCDECGCNLYEDDGIGVSVCYECLELQAQEEGQVDA